MKRLTEDLSGEIVILFISAKSATAAKASERSKEMTQASLKMSGCETATVVSSALEAIRFGEVGQWLSKKFNRQGEMTKPWGRPE